MSPTFNIKVTELINPDTGMKNAGNTCFFNSAIQMLYNTELYDIVKGIEYKDIKADTSESKLLLSLKCVFDKFDGKKIPSTVSSDNILSIKQIIALTSIDSKWNGGQEDSTEVTTPIIEKIKNEALWIYFGKFIRDKDKNFIIKKHTITLPDGTSTEKESQVTLARNIEQYLIDKLYEKEDLSKDEELKTKKSS